MRRGKCPRLLTDSSQVDKITCLTKYENDGATEGVPEREGFPSGQRDQTVNLTRKLRWFESTPLHRLEVFDSRHCNLGMPVNDAGDRTVCSSSSMSVVVSDEWMWCLAHIAQ